MCVEVCPVALTDTYCFPAPVPKDGSSPGVADAADHGGEGGGQGALAQAAGAARAAARLAPPVPAARPRGDPCRKLISEQYFTCKVAADRESESGDRIFRGNPGAVHGPRFRSVASFVPVGAVISRRRVP